MFERILVPLDGSPRAEQALPVAVLLGFLLLLLGIPAYVWMRKQQADEEKQLDTTSKEQAVV